jgi:hypothetical protein
MSENRRQQRRATDRRSTDRRKDLFAEALSNVSPDAIQAALAVADARIEIRCPAPTKAEIEKTAGRFGLTVTTYLLRLHELAQSKLPD